MNKIDSHIDSIIISLDDTILEYTIKKVEHNLKSFGLVIWVSHMD